MSGFVKRLLPKSFKKRRREKIGFILAPGGYMGAHGAGCLQAFYEKGIRPDYVQGSSIGALSAAAYVSGDMDLLEEGWLEVDEVGPRFLYSLRDIVTFFPVRRNPFLRNYVFHNKALKGLVERLDLEAVVGSEIEFRVVVRNATTNSLEIFSNQDFKNDPETFGKIILAAISIPFIFPNVRIGEFEYSDGLKIDIHDVLDFGCDRVFICVNEEDPSRPIKTFGPFDEFINANLFSHNESMKCQLRHLKEERRSKKVVVIRPKDRLATAYFFNPGDIKSALDHGRERTLKMLSRLDY